MIDKHELTVGFELGEALDNHIAARFESVVTQLLGHLFVVEWTRYFLKNLQDEPIDVLQAVGVLSWFFLSLVRHAICILKQSILFGLPLFPEKKYGGMCDELYSFNNFDL
jgi:hypothetical protein